MRIFFPVAGGICACFFLTWLLLPELENHAKTAVETAADITTPAEGLVQAARTGDMVKLGFYLGQQKPADIAETAVGRNALMAAAENGHADAAAMLLTFGVNPNFNNTLGQFPLGAAAAAGHVEVMQQLLRYHADINHGYLQKNTALIQAGGNGRSAAVELLLQHKAALWPGQGTGGSALITALHNHHEDIAWQLLNAGADSNDVDQYGNSVLMLAVKINAVNLVTELLKNKKVDKQHVNKNGETALSIAEKMSAKQLIDLLKTAE